MATPRSVVSVTFLGFLQRVAEQREISVPIGAQATVDDVLRTLARTCGQGFNQAVFRAPGKVHTHLRVFLNEEEARLSDRVVSDGSPAQVALLVVPGFEGGG